MTTLFMFFLIAPKGFFIPRFVMPIPTNPTNKLFLASLFFYVLFAWASPSAAQPVELGGYWQQGVKYQMAVELDVKTHRFKGTQELVYVNNSPDTLTRMYYHLYFNAFRPKSMMDVRSRTIADPDRRVRSRIYALKEESYGALKITKVSQDDQGVVLREAGTLGVVDLARPLLPGGQSIMRLRFEGQVPEQIRRSGRNNSEGIAYSMSQWYPKVAAYDALGWHATPYVGREFYGVFGDFDVRITLAKEYVVAGTGLLQQGDKPLASYGPSSMASKAKTATWHFVAKKVHDFVWAADPEYVQETKQVPSGPLLRFFYQPEHKKVWQEMMPYAVQGFAYLNKHYGKYPYAEYAIIQGGDGGMEYPMATLVTGDRSLESLIDVVIHEIAHSWYQGLLATDESRYAWMDEGFTVYAADRTVAFLFDESPDKALQGLYAAYRRFVTTGTEEAMSSWSDHFNTNRAYSFASYVKGALFQDQLSYVIGREAFEQGLLAYFDAWKYRHPRPEDYLRVMERASGLELDWYLNYVAHTTEVVDYGIVGVEENSSQTTRLTLAKLKEVPMPIELVLTKTDSSQQSYYIPLAAMQGHKKKERAKEKDLPRHIMTPWPWTHPYYQFSIDIPMAEVARIQIDPSGRLADIALDNNNYKAGEVLAKEAKAEDASLTLFGKVQRKD